MFGPVAAGPGLRGDPVAAWCELAGPRTDICDKVLVELHRNGIECGTFDGVSRPGLVLFETWSDALRDQLQERARDTQVIAVSADDVFISIVVEEKQALIGTSRLMMMFDAKSLELRQWVVTDPQGFDTTIAVSNLDVSRRPDPAMFNIDYTDYRRDR